jgi:hypothetical protein
LSHTDFEKMITSKMNFRKIFRGLILQGKYHFSLTTSTARSIRFEFRVQPLALLAVMRSVPPAPAQTKLERLNSKPSLGGSVDVKAPVSLLPCLEESAMMCPFAPADLDD